MPEGFIYLHRKLLDSAVWQNQDLCRFWIWCLLKGSYCEHETLVGFQTIKLLPGQFIFGRKKASEETGLSERTIRTCLHTLENLKNLTIQTTNKFSIITVANWGTYQSVTEENDQQNDQLATNKRPASDHKQERKERKEIINTSKIGAEPDEFDTFWAACPKRMRRCGKKAAYLAWEKARKGDGGMPEVGRVIQALEGQAAEWSDPQYIPMATTWLNQGRWDTGEDGLAKSNANARRAKWEKLPPMLRPEYAAQFADVLTESERAQYIKPALAQA